MREIVGGSRPGTYLVALTADDFAPNAPRRLGYRFYRNRAFIGLWISAFRRGLYLTWLR